MLQSIILSRGFQLFDEQTPPVTFLNIQQSRWCGLSTIQDGGRQPVVVVILDLQQIEIWFQLFTLLFCFIFCILTEQRTLYPMKT